MNKVLITGANGFIGSFLVEEALHQGFEVYAGVRKTSSREYLKDERIKFVELDLLSQTTLEEKFNSLLGSVRGFDYVIHNAGITFASAIKDFVTVNYEGTRNLTNALQASAMPLKKFILISSLATFGPGNSETFAPIKISDNQQPISNYGRSKLLAEQHVKSSPLPYLIINPTAVYGPRDKDFLSLMKLINNGFEFYLGYHRQIISLLYVKDLARAVIRAMQFPMVNRSYIISDGAEYDKEYLGEVIKNLLGKKTLKLKLPLTPLQWMISATEKTYALVGKRPFLNSEKIAEISCANWKCQSDEIWNAIALAAVYPLESGMEETLNWYKENHWIV